MGVRINNTQGLILEGRMDKIDLFSTLLQNESQRELTDTSLGKCVSGRLCMQVLLYRRYCSTAGGLTPLPCRVVNHCLVVQVLDITEGQRSKS